MSKGGSSGLSVPFKAEAKNMKRGGVGAGQSRSQKCKKGGCRGQALCDVRTQWRPNTHPTFRNVLATCQPRHVFGWGFFGVGVCDGMRAVLFRLGLRGCPPPPPTTTTPPRASWCLRVAQGRRRLPPQPWEVAAGALGTVGVAVEPRVPTLRRADHSRQSSSPNGMACTSDACTCRRGARHSGHCR